MAKTEASGTAVMEEPELPVAGPGEKVFAVRYPKDAPPVNVAAVNAAEAWSAFCDKNKTWPSPKLGTVTEVK